MMVFNFKLAYILLENVGNLHFVTIAAIIWQADCLFMNGSTPHLKNYIATSASK
jgi:hypothetical protein